MFSTGGQLIITGAQNILNLTFFVKKSLPLDGQSRQAKSTSQLVNLPSAWSILKHLACGKTVIITMLFS